MINTSQQLYARWVQTAENHASELALLETQSSQQWTFSELRDAAEQKNDPPGPVIFPSGLGSTFILALLAAWRAGRLTCPLVAGQQMPSFENLPAGCAHLKLTSATTGAAKCVAFTAAQLEADVRNIVSTMGLRPEWPNLGVISLAHSYGFSNLVLPLLLQGIPLILAAAPLPEAVLSSAKHAANITLPAVPALWRTWFETDSIPRNTKLAISAGAPLPVELERTIHERHGIKVHNFYGSSECGGIAYDRSEIPREDSRTGSALDNVRLSVGEPGTLTVEGPAVGETYWPPDPRAELHRGRFITADLAEIHDGQVYLRGRTSEVIHIAGQKVAPEHIETILRSHPAVRECLVFGVPAPEQERSEIIVAAVNCASAVPARDLVGYLSTRIPAWQIPREWWFCSELAADLRGKIPRSEWRRKSLQKINPPSAFELTLVQ